MKFAEALMFFLENLKQAFAMMADFKLIYDFSLLDFLVVLLVLHVCISLFFGHIPRVNADRAVSSLASSLGKRNKSGGNDNSKSR